MKSREFFEAVCRALENAQEPAAQLRSGDRDVFLRAKEILQVCYEGNSSFEISSALQRRACSIMLDVSDPDEWDGALNVCGAAWRLSNVSPDPGGDEAATAVARSSNAAQQSETQVVLQQLQVLQHHLGLLDSELDIQLVVSSETNVGKESLQYQLRALRRPLVLITDIAASGVGFSDYFGVGTAGIRSIENISASIVSALYSAQGNELFEEARGLVQKSAIGVRDLLRPIAGSGVANSTLTDCLINFEKNIEPYLVTVQTAHRDGIFKDIAEPWCPEMINIPPGEYLMGSNDSAHQDEMPQHQVRIGTAFAVGCCPVTFGEYDVYCKETKCEMPSDNGWAAKIDRELTYHGMTRTITLRG